MIDAPVSSSAAPGIPHDIFDTHGLPRPDGFEIWRESLMPLFEPQLEASEGFFARVDGFHLRRLVVSLAEFSDQRYVRRTGYRADEGADHLLVQLYLTGGYAGHNGHRTVRVGPGDISLLDLSYPLETAAEGSSTISVVIPRDLMFSLVRPEQLSVGSVISAHSAVGRILGHHLTSVWRALHSASAEDDEQISRTLLGAIVGAFAGYRGGDNSASLSDDTMLDAICAYIEQNLCSRELTPEHLCLRFACSRARLYRLFHPLGGVAAYVRQLRLERCLRELSKQHPTTSTIHDVAQRWGFRSQSHFCRQFRKQFGIAPSEALERARTRNDTDTAPERCLSSWRPAFYDWLRQL